MSLRLFFCFICICLCLAMLSLDDIAAYKEKELFHGDPPNLDHLTVSSQFAIHELSNNSEILLKQHQHHSVSDHTTPYPSSADIPTFAFERITIPGQGFFNQRMAFTGALITLYNWMAMAKMTGSNCQILLPSLPFFDFLGSNLDVEFDDLFDSPFSRRYNSQASDKSKLSLSWISRDLTT